MAIWLTLIFLLAACAGIIFACNYRENTETRISKYSVMISRATGVFSSIRYFHDKLAGYEMVQQRGFNTIFTFERFPICENYHSWRITLHNETLSGRLAIMPLDENSVQAVYQDRLMLRPEKKIRPVKDYEDMIARAVKLHKSVKKRFRAFLS